MQKVSRPTVSLVWRYCPHYIGPSSLITSFLPLFNLFFFRKNVLQSFPLGREPSCRPPCELLGTERSSTKAERRPKTCKRFQDQQCHQFGDAVLTTLVPYPWYTLEDPILM